MKTLLTLLLFVLLFAGNNYAQTIVRKYEYAIVFLDEYGKNKIIIHYGNKIEENFAEIKKIELEGGRFNNTSNIVDAFNYMDGKGYELVTTLVENIGQGTTTGHQYIFRREIKQEIK